MPLGERGFAGRLPCELGGKAADDFVFIIDELRWELGRAALAPQPGKHVLQQYANQVPSFCDRAWLFDGQLQRLNDITAA